MSLLEQSQKWFPTHVQATVLQATGLQAKGKNGTNDAYTIIQLGKEKYSTSVSEKTLEPIWREEASFELPGLLLEGNPEVYELCFIVMHRSLVGMDKFLGQRFINLNEIFDNKQRRKTDWYVLESKPGKKRKERGRIQVSIQFMRNNMTASMFDLSSMKDKPRSPFSKLKGKMKGRKHELPSDTSSAVLPRSALCDPEQPQPGPPRGPGAQAPPETKAKRKLLAGSHKLSAAHSMSDLIGSHVRPKLDSMNSIDESGGPHRRSQSDVPDFAGVEAGGDPFGDLSDGLPQKYATLPRNHNPNPFQGEAAAAAAAAAWEPGAERQKKDKVSLLERVTGKKDARKAANGARTGSTSDLRVANPFSADVQFTNPFKSSDSKPTAKGDLKFGQKTRDVKKNVPPQETAAAYSNLSFDEVVRELVKQKEVGRKKDSHIRELEDYIDNLLVRVMEETPSILRTPYEPKRKAGKISKK